MTSNREWNLFFAVKRCIRYHQRRRSWFESCHHMTLLGVVFTTGGVAARLELVQPDTEGAQFISWGLALLSGALVTANIVFRFAERAAEHKGLAKRWRALEAALSPIGPLSDREYKRYVAQRLQIENDEPPVMRLLDALCHHELKKALYPEYSDDEVKAVRKAAPLSRRAVAHLFSQPLTAARVPR